MSTKHPTTPNIPEDPEDMKAWARSFADLRYDKLYDFMSYMADHIEHDAEADEQRGRKQLSSELYYLSTTVRETSRSLKIIWNICKHYF